MSRVESRKAAGYSEMGQGLRAPVAPFTIDLPLIGDTQVREAGFLTMVALARGDAADGDGQIAAIVAETRGSGLNARGLLFVFSVEGARIFGEQLIARADESEGRAAAQAAAALAAARRPGDAR